MPNSLTEQIKTELETLQKELDQFQKSVEYLSGAKNHVDKAVKTVHKAEDYHNKKAQELMEAYDAIADLKDLMKALSEIIEDIEFPDYNDLLENLNQVKRNSDAISSDTQKLINLDLDSKIRNVLDSIKKTHNKVDGVEKKILKEYKETTKRLQSEINNALHKILTEQNEALISLGGQITVLKECFQHNEKAHKIYSFITWGIIIIIGIVIILVYK